jgi:hypothetical protein
MLINEIFDTKIKNIKANSLINSDLLDDKQNGRKVINRPFSSVIIDDDNPHVVNKISKHDDYAYNIYVDYIVKNKLAQKNPHFPRIYNIESIKVKSVNGGFITKYKWEIERLNTTLHEWLDIDSQPNPLRFTREFSEELRPKLLLLSEHYLSPEKNKTFQFLFQNEEIRGNDVYQKFYDCFRNSQHLKQGLFKDAFRIVEELHKISNARGQRGVTYDLHPNNFMLRFGKYIPQIVILDPFASWDK